MAVAAGSSAAATRCTAPTSAPSLTASPYRSSCRPAATDAAVARLRPTLRWRLPLGRSRLPPCGTVRLEPLGRGKGRVLRGLGRLLESCPQGRILGPQRRDLRGEHREVGLQPSV